jgi:hypothetical protein
LLCPGTDRTSQQQEEENDSRKSLETFAYHKCGDVFSQKWNF